MLEPFIIHALIAGLGVAAMSGMLGCFIVWQRLAYFGDTIAHAALLGVVLGLLLNIPLELSIIIVSLAIALGIAWMQHHRHFAVDTLLGIAAHGALALGLVLLALSREITVDINHYLFGDILAASSQDAARIWHCALLVLMVLGLRWRNLLRMALHPDIAQVEGVPVRRMRLLLMLTIALVVAVSIKAVGMLLVTSLLIVPAACARYLSRTPTQMAILATLAGMLAVTGGLATSLAVDTPTGPTIILVAMALFIMCYAFKGRSS